MALLLAFAFFMGLMLSRLLSFILGFSNGPQLIMLAFGGTGVIFAAMATIATVSKRDFSGLGKWLFVGVIVILLAAFANIFLQLPALMRSKGGCGATPVRYMPAHPHLDNRSRHAQAFNEESEYRGSAWLSLSVHVRDLVLFLARIRLPVPAPLKGNVDRRAPIV
jgi:hypothetical protein